MAKKIVIGAVILVILWISLIIIIPIQLFSIKFSLYDHINKRFSFIYEPSSPSPIEKLYVNADEANIEIRYIDPPVNYYALIDVSIALIGENLPKKLYNDYLNISWNNSSSPIDFRIGIISDDWFNPSFWLKKEINVDIYLRKDIVFDIITNLTKGNFEITIPRGVLLGDLLTNVSNGNIFYNFEQCSIQGSIIGNIDDGDLIFKSNDVQYSQNSSWDITIGEGNMHIEVFQFREIGTNITGIFKVKNGDVFVLYEDNSANIGAILEIPYGDPFMSRTGLPICIRSTYNFTCTEVKGFDYDHIPFDSVEGIVNFISYDLLANIVKHYYNMRFEIIYGSFSMRLSSDPKFK